MKMINKVLSPCAVNVVNLWFILIWRENRNKRNQNGAYAHVSVNRHPGLEKHTHKEIQSIFVFWKVLYSETILKQCLLTSTGTKTPCHRYIEERYVRNDIPYKDSSDVKKHQLDIGSSTILCKTESTVMAPSATWRNLYQLLGELAEKK